MNLATIIDEHPGGHTALVVGAEHIGYGRLRAEVAAVRAGLGELGLNPGDRVGIMCGINDRFVRSWFGVLGAGLVAVPLDPQSPTPELERELGVVGARAVIVGPAGMAGVEGLDRSALPDLEFVLVPAGAVSADALDFDALGATAPRTPIVERTEDDLAALLFTSGTAGAPKAARLTHGNLASNLRQVQAHSGGASRPDDVGGCRDRFGFHFRRRLSALRKNARLKIFVKRVFRRGALRGKVNGGWALIRINLQAFRLPRSIDHRFFAGIHVKVTVYAIDVGQAPTHAFGFHLIDTIDVVFIIDDVRRQYDQQLETVLAVRLVLEEITEYRYLGQVGHASVGRPFLFGY